jgi:hypothetical protein
LSGLNGGLAAPEELEQNNKHGQVGRVRRSFKMHHITAQQILRHFYFQRPVYRAFINKLRTELHRILSTYFRLHNTLFLLVTFLNYSSWIS